MRIFLHGAACSPIAAAMIERFTSTDKVQVFYLLALAAVLHIALMSAVAIGMISKEK